MYIYIYCIEYLHFFANIWYFNSFPMAPFASASKFSAKARRTSLKICGAGLQAGQQGRNGSFDVCSGDIQ